MRLPLFLQGRQDGVLLSIKLQPRASRNEICNVTGSELKVKVTAAPVDSAANEALVRLLSETLDCPRSAIEIVRGQTSRHKQVLVRGCPADAVAGKLPAQA
jgi:uncharacterized protein (TIGR00251 family)